MVDLIADANFNSIAFTGKDQDTKLALPTKEACIANVYVEDRSAPTRALLSHRTQLEGKKDETTGSVGKAINDQKTKMKKEMKTQKDNGCSLDYSESYMYAAGVIEWITSTDLTPGKHKKLDHVESTSGNLLAGVQNSVC